MRTVAFAGLIVGLIAILAIYGFQQAKLAQESLSRMEIQKAEELFTAGESSTALAYFARVLRQNPANRVAAERVLSALTHRGFRLPVTEPLRHKAEVRSAQFSPDGHRLVTASGDKTARV